MGGEIAETRPRPRRAVAGRDYAPAGWWPRAGAFITDSILVFLLELAVKGPLGLSTIGGHHVADDRQLLGLAIDLALVAIYFSLVMWRTNGLTVGKRALSLRVVRMTGEPMSVPVALVREVVAKELAWGLVLVDTLVIFGPGELVLLLNYLWPLWEGRNRALHDLFAGTRVLREFR